MSLRHRILWLAPLALLLIGVWAFRALGYTTAYSMHAVEELAEKFVKEGRNARDCFKIRTFIPTYPPLGQFQSFCIRKVAELTKDPTACEMLLPGEYGWSCLGAAMENEPCTFGLYADPRVKGNGIVATLEECVSGPPDVRSNGCCHIARIKYLEAGKDCSGLAGEAVLEDQCFHEVALKRKDVSVCSLIGNENIRIGCGIQVRALSGEE